MRCNEDPEARRLAIELCRRDVVFFASNFLWTFDPRPEVMASVPFNLWPRQIEYLRWLQEREQLRQEGMVEKSRDVGVTYLNCAFALHRWIFVRGYKSTFAANLVDLVDALDDPDTIFEKIRIMIRFLPIWLRPAGFDLKTHARYLRIFNPENRNVIVGEGGTNIGRGGRSTIIFLDEAAHIMHAQKVNAASSATTPLRIWCSSVSGMGNLFAQKTHAKPAPPIFTFHWRSDPRKSDAWAEKTRNDVGVVTFASEFDIDYGASVEGLLILKAWIDAAVELRERLGASYRAPRGAAGGDIGAGKAENVLCVIKGALVMEPDAWRDPDSIDTGHRMLAGALAANVAMLVYDSVSVGQGVTATLKRADTTDLEVIGLNTGENASDEVWPDGKLAHEKFRNCKAELWWKARERFQRSYQHLRHLKGLPGGKEQPIEDVFLMADDVELRRQLNTPRWFRTERGLIMVETKEKLAKRSVASPDRADAFVQALYVPRKPTFYVGG